MTTIPEGVVNGTDRSVTVALQAYSRAVVAAELWRLSRRIPALGPHDLRVVEEALHRLTHVLVLDRLQALAPHHLEALQPLFAGLTPPET